MPWNQCHILRRRHASGSTGRTSAINRTLELNTPPTYTHTHQKESPLASAKGFTGMETKFPRLKILCSALRKGNHIAEGHKRSASLLCMEVRARLHRAHLSPNGWNHDVEMFAAMISKVIAWGSKVFHLPLYSIPCPRKDWLLTLPLSWAPPPSVISQEKEWSKRGSKREGVMESFWWLLERFLEAVLRAGEQKDVRWPPWDSNTTEVALHFSTSWKR